MRGPGEAVGIEGLGVRRGGRWVLRGLGLRIAAGEKVSLTGPSGAGKSTVLRCVLGLAVPQEGTIRVMGRAVEGAGAWEARRRMAYVAQEPDLGRGTAGEAIERPFAYRANAALRGNLGRLPGLLERLGLPRDLPGRPISALSGGEKQRVALISALLLDRPILLLDEASSALDGANRQAVSEVLRQTGGLTVLSVAHDAQWLGFPHRVVPLAARGPQGGA